MNRETETSNPTAPGPSAADIRKTLGIGTKSRGRALRVAAIVCVLGAAAAVMAGALYARAGRQAQQFEPAESRRGDLTVTVRATGTLQAITSVEVGAEVTGRILAVNVDANDRVTTGQVLAVIDPEELRAAVDKETAQVAAAEAAISLARVTARETQRTYDRTLALKEKSIVSLEDLDTATAARDRAAATLESATANAALAKATLKSVTSRLAKATIRSPIAGSVLSRLVEPGQTVTAGFQTPVMFKLAQDLTQMRLNVDVDEADVGRVRDGMEASFTVEAYPDHRFVSRVLSLHNEPKTSSNVVTYQAVLSVDNRNGLLRPGMTCTATIVSETRRDVLMIPNAALRFTPPSKQARPGDKKAGKQDAARLQKVWVLVNGEPTAVELKTGASDGTMTEVLEGALKPTTPLLVDVKEAA